MSVFERLVLTCSRCRHDVNKGRVPVALRQGGVDVPLAGRVGPEIDGAAGKDAHQVGPESLEKAGHALIDKDVSEIQ